MARKPTRSPYMTKSRFKLGLECPTKLYYTGKAEYANQSLTDSFLEALASGGYQVGELAKHYFPGGHDIKTMDHETALAETQAFLQQEQVVIYEAAVKYQNLFARVDILVKDGKQIRFYEVKAKSYDPEKDCFFKKGSKGLKTEWAPYLHDVAFQKHVITKAYPDMQVEAFLMMVNKGVQAATDGLNTRFKIIKSGKNRKEISVSSTLSESDLEPRMLHAVDVQNELAYICEEESFEERSFQAHVAHLAAIYGNDNRTQGTLTKACAKCEFRCSSEAKDAGLLDGYRECWTSTLNWTDADLNEPLVTDIWNFRATDKLMKQGKYKIAQLDETDIEPKPDTLPGLSQSQRQWLQVQKAQNNDAETYLDIEGLRAEMKNWVYPLHFIDFETSAPALPFTRGMSPYESIAFQFSHHVYHEDGRVEHAGQFLSSTPGQFPNIDFIRALKQQLDTDNGTIFRYSAHENTYLTHIFWQLKEKSGLPTEEISDLCEFIKTITHTPRKATANWRGARDMVDLWELVKRYYYAPMTNGSNSIKHVLPAVLNSSEYVKAKYSRPVYGGDGNIPSLNFNNHQWVHLDGSVVKDPYELLPKLFADFYHDADKLLSDDDSLASGGAAMTAYSKLQFTDMSEEERDAIRAGLLRYCELDTLAMVIIVEAWMDWIKFVPQKLEEKI